jgi:hypothetical protein
VLTDQQAELVAQTSWPLLEPFASRGPFD